MLEKKSITELRGIAQALGCKYGWDDDKAHLLQKIRLKQNEVVPKVIAPIYEAPSDQRLRTMPPSKVSNEEQIKKILAPLIAIGLHFEIKGDSWFMRHDKKEDSGSMRIPPSHILRCAEKMML